MKHLLLVPYFAILFLVLGILWFYLNSLAPARDKNFASFIIANGENAAQIGANLQKSGFVKSGLVFKIFVQLTGVSGRIQAGEFRLSPSENLFQISSELVHGPVEVWVTIPEGFRREEIAAKFTKELDKDSAFAADFLKASEGKEGYLFPDTYLFPKYASGSAIVAKMTGTFDAKTAGLTPKESNLSKKDLVILASLIERETKTDAERPVVAGILIKRVNVGWPLQIDATVQYALANVKCQMSNVKCSEWWESLGGSDTSIDSPFNTYKFPGLPPTPIANPGLSSLSASYNPVSTDYWYYLHDSTGTIHYAATLEEQNANIAKYLAK